MHSTDTHLQQRMTDFSESKAFLHAREILAQECCCCDRTFIRQQGMIPSSPAGMTGSILYLALLKGTGRSWAAMRDWVTKEGAVNLDFLVRNFGRSQIWATEVERCHS